MTKSWYDIRICNRIFAFFSFRGVFYILDGKEQEIARGINPRCPMWGVIDLYGNVKGILMNINVFRLDNAN